MVQQIARSQRLLFSQRGAATNTPAFVCPAGYVTLVKQLYVYSPSGTDVKFHLVTQIATAGISIFILSDTVTTGLTKAYPLWYVLHPGDTAYVYVEAGTATVHLSGAVLFGGPTVAPAEFQTPRVVEATPPPVLAADLSPFPV